MSIQSETSTHYLAFCPFHDNRRTPSFAIDMTTGEYYCFNPDCGKFGHGLVDLVRWLGKKTEPEARRLISKRGGEVKFNVQNILDKIWEDKSLPYFPQMKIDELKTNFWNSAEARDYMYGRGFNNQTLTEFEVGYSDVRKMVVVPVHDHEGSPVGLVGRSTEGKRHHNSKKLPRNEVLFNLHRAKRVGATVVVVESQFDAMRVHQVGHPNVVAILGSSLSKIHYSLLDRHFSRIIIMTDSDAAGRKAGRNLAAALNHKNILWAVHELGTVYPGDAKDAGDLEDEQIKHCIDNAISDFEYWAYKGL